MIDRVNSLGGFKYRLQIYDIGMNGQVNSLGFLKYRLHIITK